MSPRQAWLCVHEDHKKPKGLAYRVFLLPGETIEAKACPEHGKRSMALQGNHTYLGKPVAA